MNSYFKKPDSKQKIWLAGLNSWLKFEDADGETAIFKTDHPKIVLEIQQLIRSNVGGVEIITEAQYNEWEAKKKLPRNSSPIWREELGGQRKRVMGDTTGVQTRPLTKAAAAPVVAAAAKRETPEAVVEGARPVALKAEDV
jgi:hypothetical protein